MRVAVRGAGATVANRTHDGSALRELPVVSYNVKHRQEPREERRLNLDGKSRKGSLRCVSAEMGKMKEAGEAEGGNKLHEQKPRGRKGMRH